MQLRSDADFSNSHLISHDRLAIFYESGTNLSVSMPLITPALHSLGVTDVVGVNRLRC